MYAAQISPEEWPTAAAAVTPHARSCSTSASCTAVVAGCDTRVVLASSPSIAASRSHPPSFFTMRAHSCSVAQYTGSESRQSLPIPRHCAPCPQNTKHTGRVACSSAVA